MKLLEILDVKKFHRFTREQILQIDKLVVEVSMSEQDESGYWFIITDVPAIPRDKFRKLMELSFPDNLTCDKWACTYNEYVYVETLDTPMSRDLDAELKVTPTTWKQFVDWMIDHWPITYDDFDE